MGAQILIVDDELEICRSLRRLLRRFELEVTCATNPAEALVLMSKARFDMVISDYRMPDMYGTEFLAEVARRTPATLRLMLSACAEIDTLAANYDETKILRFIRKPWNDDELAANLVALLAAKGATPAPTALTVAAIEAARSRVW
jgi:diguanylate cyclase